jgi:hypothetical protein
MHTMWRTKIIIRTSTTTEDVLRALPEGFQGGVTIVEKRENCQVCIIHHSTCIDPEDIYKNLKIPLCSAIMLPRFMFERS